MPVDHLVSEMHRCWRSSVGLPLGLSMCDSQYLLMCLSPERILPRLVVPASFATC